MGLPQGVYQYPVPLRDHQLQAPRVSHLVASLRASVVTLTPTPHHFQQSNNRLNPPHKPQTAAPILKHSGSVLASQILRLQVHPPTPTWLLYRFQGTRTPHAKSPSEVVSRTQAPLLVPHPTRHRTLSPQPPRLRRRLSHPTPPAVVRFPLEPPRTTRANPQATKPRRLLEARWCWRCSPCLP